MKFIKDILTGIDNDTYDIGRTGFLLGLLTFLGLEIFVVGFKGAVFDMVAFGTAFGLMIAALGAALHLKSKTEPGGDNADKGV